MSNIFEAFEKIAEKKIREAMDNGEFDDLPGKGKPLQLEDDRHIAQDIRLAHKILKNANCLPPELELRKEILTMEELLDGVRDTKEKYRQIKKLNYLIMKLNMSRRGSLDLEKHQVYYDRLVEQDGEKGQGGLNGKLAQADKDRAAIKGPTTLISCGPAVLWKYTICRVRMNESWHRGRSYPTGPIDPWQNSYGS